MKRRQIQNNNLEIGELFVKHIETYDNGYTLGIAAQAAKKNSQWTLEPVVGASSQEGYTRATIGAGEIRHVERSETSSGSFDYAQDDDPLIGEKLLL
ncbi:MAG: hypothetical protein AABY27_00755 [Pseudomonadota bacterium]